MPNAEKIDQILRDCLFKDENEASLVEPILVEGLVQKFGFHPQRIENHKIEIMKELSDLPNEFYTNGGGGWTFLNLCHDREGNQWGEHHNMEQLVVLGMAIGKVKYQLPRSMWNVLPGGVPYISIEK